MEARGLGLRHLFRHAEHLARSSEIEARDGRERLESRQEEMRAIDVGVQRGELVVEGVADETLRRQVVALVGLDLVDYAVDAGIAFERCRMKFELRPDV